ncbi:MAG: Type 1 glutamine amidotransferase-like domain-containing protein [Patescibacteria group bacterium]|nr:Type 1 glutamine amidotransferase-like domain-containing protein [Patescibacteria group bacterium]
MKLLLTSAGLTNRSIADALLDLAKKPFAELNLAIIPTAANMEKGDKGWMIDDYFNCKKQGFKLIDIVDISALPQNIWRPRLEAADVLLFEGGNSFYLNHWIEKSGLKEILPQMLETRVYVGISAGSMVVCKNLDLSTSEKLYYDAPSEFDKNEGLGYIDILIRPHLNSPDFPNVNMGKLTELAQEYPEEFYAIDDNSAIKINGDEIAVVSEGIWKKFN